MQRRRPTTRSGLRAPIFCCALAVVLMSLGPRGESFVRALIRDASLPALVAGERLRKWKSGLDPTRWPWTREWPSETGSAPQVTRNDAVPAELRRLRFELAREREQLASFQASLGPIRWPVPTADGVRRIAARVLRPESPFSQAGGLIVSAGTASGIEPNRIAVEPVLLSARDENVPRRATLLAGATVVGMTDEVGAWTSAIVPVSDSKFRAHVRLVRQGPSGTVMGEQGVLEGDGDRGCVVKYVPSTAAVEVGDHVYSFDPTGRIPQPLYYGEVDRAELRPEAPHWDIHVRPTVDLAHLREVQVLLEDAPVPELAVDQ